MTSPSARPDPLPGSIPRVLVVDDQDVGRELLAFWVGLHGVDVTAVADADAALGVLQVIEHDLVLTDISMPGMDGVGLLGRIRKRWTMPVVAVTSHARPGDRERFLAAGFDAYVPKPVERRGLDHVLQRFLPQASMAWLRPHAATGTSSDRTRRRVLVVDADDERRMRASLWMEEAGIDVVGLAAVQDGADLAADGPYDLVLADRDLPGSGDPTNGLFRLRSGCPVVAFGNGSGPAPGFDGMLGELGPPGFVDAVFSWLALGRRDAVLR